MLFKINSWKYEHGWQRIKYCIDCKHRCYSCPSFARSRPSNFFLPLFYNNFFWFLHSCDTSFVNIPDSMSLKIISKKIVTLRLLKLVILPRLVASGKRNVKVGFLFKKLVNQSLEAILCTSYPLGHATLFDFAHSYANTLTSDGVRP